MVTGEGVPVGSLSAYHCEFQATVAPSGKNWCEETVVIGSVYSGEGGDVHQSQDCIDANTR